MTAMLVHEDVIARVEQQLGDDRWNLCAWIGAKAAFQEMAAIIEAAVECDLCAPEIGALFHVLLDASRQKVMERAKGDGEGEGRAEGRRGGEGERR